MEPGWLGTVAGGMALMKSCAGGGSSTVLTCGSSWPRGGRGPHSRHSSSPLSSVKVNSLCGTCSRVRGGAKHGPAPPTVGTALAPPAPPHSPWGSHVAGTPGSRERPEVAGTPPARGAARLQACPGATSSRSLPPLGLIPAD